MGLRFKDLRIWKESMEITENIYKITKNFPETHIPQIKNRFWDLLRTQVLKLNND